MAPRIHQKSTKGSYWSSPSYAALKYPEQLRKWSPRPPRRISPERLSHISLLTQLIILGFCFSMVDAPIVAHHIHHHPSTTHKITTQTKNHFPNNSYSMTQTNSTTGPIEHIAEPQLKAGLERTNTTMIPQEFLTIPLEHTDLPKEGTKRCTHGQGYEVLVDGNICQYSDGKFVMQLRTKAAQTLDIFLKKLYFSLNKNNRFFTNLLPDKCYMARLELEDLGNIMLGVTTPHCLSVKELLVINPINGSKSLLKLILEKIDLATALTPFNQDQICAQKQLTLLTLLKNEDPYDSRIIESEGNSGKMSCEELQQLTASVSFRTLADVKEQNARLRLYTSPSGKGFYYNPHLGLEVSSRFFLMRTDDSQDDIPLYLSSGRLSVIESFFRNRSISSSSVDIDLETGGARSAFFQAFTEDFNLKPLITTSYYFSAYRNIAFIVHPAASHLINFMTHRDNFGSIDNKNLKRRVTLLRLLEEDDYRNEVMIQDELESEFICGVFLPEKLEKPLPKELSDDTSVYLGPHRIKREINSFFQVLDDPTKRDAIKICETHERSVREQAVTNPNLKNLNTIMQSFTLLDD